MKKIILGIVIVGLAIWGVVKYRQSSEMPAINPVVVKASKVEEMVLPVEVKAIGTVVARGIEVTPEVAGHVETIIFADGSFVEKGAPLIQLDDAVFRAKLASAKAKLHFSQNDYQRKKLLGKQGAIAKQAIDQAEADFKEKQAEAQESQVMLDKMRLNAPFAGMVGQRKINPGDYVTVGQGLVTLTDTKHLRVEYNIPEKYLSNIKVGQAVEIRTAAYPNQLFKGEVAFISPTINSNNRSIALYAEVPNENGKLAAGMLVDLVQSLAKEAKTIVIPARSLVPALDGEQVYKVVNGHAQVVNVLIGRRFGNHVQVTQGLVAGDVVVTDGQLKLRNNMPVKTQG